MCEIIWCSGQFWLVLRASCFLTIEIHLWDINFKPYFKYFWLIVPKSNCHILVQYRIYLQNMLSIFRRMTMLFWYRVVIWMECSSLFINHCSSKSEGSRHIYLFVFTELNSPSWHDRNVALASAHQEIFCLNTVINLTHYCSLHFIIT